MKNRCVSAVLAALAAAVWCPWQAHANIVVYENDFETPATAFDSLSAAGTLASLSTWSLPTDSGGISSVHQSTWLGRLGLSVGKSGTIAEIVNLSLTGLTPGQHYDVAFDL